MAWQLIGWVVGLPIALYGLHRLALRMEERVNSTISTSGRGGVPPGTFVALQRAIDPRSRHVEQAPHVEHRVEEDEASGRGDADPAV